MNKVMKLALLLGTISLVITFALAEVNSITKPEILRQQAEKTNKALRSVLPEAAEGVIEPVQNDKGEVDYYIGYGDKEKKELIGYAFEASKSGYSGDVVEIVGITPEGEIKKVVITRHTETPGLGAKCTMNEPFDGKKWSLQQFIGKKAGELKVDKDGGNIVSITGATITSRAVTKGIRAKMEKVLKAVKKGA
jgi:electron transport complex protein RnfG